MIKAVRGGREACRAASWELSVAYTGPRSTSAGEGREAVERGSTTVSEGTMPGRLVEDFPRAAFVGWDPGGDMG